MNGPGPDEKVCPFCAEIIKKAAIKCRYCRSDLPAPETAERPVSLVPDPDPDLLDAYFEADFGVFGIDDLAEVDADEPPAGDGAPLDRPLSAAPDVPARRWSSAAVALALVCVLLAAGSVSLLLRDTDRRSRPPGAPHTVSVAFRDDAMAAAVENAVTVLSYSYKTLVADEEIARSVMSPDFVADYQRVMAQARPEALRARLTLKATVVATSLVSVDPRHAAALLFVNTVSTAEDSPKQHRDEKRVLMMMTRKDGEWIVSKIDAF